MPLITLPPPLQNNVPVSPSVLYQVLYKEENPFVDSLGDVLRLLINRWRRTAAANGMSCMNEEGGGGSTQNTHHQPQDCTS